MEVKDELKAHIKQQAIASFPSGFLESYLKRAQAAYLDTFEQVRHDKSILPEQQIHKLRQDRCFRMDYELAACAESFKLPVTSKTLAENDWQYTYAIAGQFGVTQSYVQRMGEMPNPAKFRETLADNARIPRLPLDDDPEIFLPRQFYGLLAHNPIGRKFTESEQKLGSIQLCVPCVGMKAWALEVPLLELISLYPAETKAPIATPSPTWKKTERKKESGES